MIYSTLAYGEYADKYSKHISKLGQTYNIHVLTDKPELFDNVFVHSYSRNIFSYYEKLIFIVKLVIEKKDRVNYIDADMMWNLDKQVDLDLDSIYSYQIYNIDDQSLENILGKERINEVLKKAGWNIELKDYIPEGIISFPYIDSIKNILKDLIYLQPFFEDYFNKKNSWNKNTYRYGKYGVGYGEGAALTAIAHKYSIPYKAIGRTAFGNKSSF